MHVWNKPHRPHSRCIANTSRSISRLGFEFLYLLLVLVQLRYDRYLVKIPLYLGTKLFKPMRPVLRTGDPSQHIDVLRLEPFSYALYRLSKTVRVRRVRWRLCRTMLVSLHVGYTKLHRYMLSLEYFPLVTSIICISTCQNLSTIRRYLNTPLLSVRAVKRTCYVCHPMSSYITNPVIIPVWTYYHPVTMLYEASDNVNIYMFLNFPVGFRNLSVGERAYACF